MDKLEKFVSKLKKDNRVIKDSIRWEPDTVDGWWVMWKEDQGTEAGVVNCSDLVYNDPLEDILFRPPKG